MNVEGSWEVSIKLIFMIPNIDYDLCSILLLTYKTNIQKQTIQIKQQPKKLNIKNITTKSKQQKSKKKVLYCQRKKIRFVSVIGL